MGIRTIRLRLAFGLLASAFCASLLPNALAQNIVVTYQGRIVDNGTPFK